MLKATLYDRILPIDDNVDQLATLVRENTQNPFEEQIRAAMSEYEQNPYYQRLLAGESPEKLVMEVERQGNAEIEQLAEIAPSAENLKSYKRLYPIGTGLLGFGVGAGFGYLKNYADSILSHQETFQRFNLETAIGFGIVLGIFGTLAYYASDLSKGQVRRKTIKELGLVSKSCL